MHELDRPQWQRNQVEAALWRYTATAPHGGADPHGLAGQVPRVFRSRVKKLLNLDRIPSMLPWEGLEGMWAFYAGPGGGTGSEDRFSSFDVFMLSVALALLNMGLKQAEVVWVAKHTRPALHKQFRRLHRRPDTTPPISGTARSPRAIHRTLWMVVRREEVQEAQPGFQKKIGERAIPLFLEPEFFEGFDAVSERFSRQLSGHRHAILIELAEPALALPRYLEEAPVARRGRPSRA